MKCYPIFIEKQIPQTISLECFSHVIQLKLQLGSFDSSSDTCPNGNDNILKSKLTDSYRKAFTVKKLTVQHRLV